MRTQTYGTSIFKIFRTSISPASGEQPNSRNSGNFHLCKYTEKSVIEKKKLLKI